MTDDILFTTADNGLGSITLHRPKALNSLTNSMIESISAKLAEWEHDAEITAILLNGSGSRAFCAGADIKALYEAQFDEQQLQDADHFFKEEYNLDLAIANFPKPIIALLSGIVMGGGVGLSYGATTKIVTETTRWAMPEMSIGFFPDIGATYFLNKAPGYTGRYLALTGTHINAADALYIGVATHFIPQDELLHFSNELMTVKLNDGYEFLLERHTTKPTIQGVLETQRIEIDQHFSYSTIEEIMASLAQSNSTFAQETLAIMQAASPVSLKVTLQLLLDGSSKSYAQCLETDLRVAKNFMRHDDFYEGVRSVVIDKDHSPNYKLQSLADVSHPFVMSFLQEHS